VEGLGQDAGLGANRIVRRTEKDERRDFAASVLDGLARRPRAIPCRFFYDAAGSELFDKITELPEYYPTRTETALLAAHGGEIAAHAGEGVALVEFGAGSAPKTGTLLDALPGPSAYVPIDICAASLASATRFSERHKQLEIHPVVADFTQVASLPAVLGRAPKLGFFSGSTIGNLTHGEAKDFLSRARGLLGQGSLFLIGVDLKKDLDVLLPAYDDAQGVTADFNLNLLARINRELDGDFDLSCFAHEATYNDAAGRVEIHIVSLSDQQVSVLGRKFRFKQGECIHTENSHKYSVEEFQALATSSGWTPVEAWTDANRLFSLHLLRA
jgi:L-histidine Nalpha-methyltransferase